MNVAVQDHTRSTSSVVLALRLVQINRNQVRGDSWIHPRVAGTRERCCSPVHTNAGARTHQLARITDNKPNHSSRGFILCFQEYRISLEDERNTVS
jgi:hypothetical protein